MPYAVPKKLIFVPVAGKVGENPGVPGLAWVFAPPETEGPMPIDPLPEFEIKAVFRPFCERKFQNPGVVEAVAETMKTRESRLGWLMVGPCRLATPSRVAAGNSPRKRSGVTALQ